MQGKWTHRSSSLGSGKSLTELRMAFPLIASSVCRNTCCHSSRPDQRRRASPQQSRRTLLPSTTRPNPKPQTQTLNSSTRADNSEARRTHHRATPRGLPWQHSAGGGGDGAANAGAKQSASPGAAAATSWSCLGKSWRVMRSTSVALCEPRGECQGDTLT
jgi:hypothetical protein